MKASNGLQVPTESWKLNNEAPEATLRLGEFLGRRLKQGIVICLSGGLGAGKTVFVRGVARGFLDSKELIVTSPTYVLQHIYEQAGKTVVHVDAYRISGAQEFAESGLQDCLYAQNCVTCIEWPERISEIIPEERIDVSFSHKGGDLRAIELTVHGKEMISLLEEIKEFTA